MLTYGGVVSTFICCKAWDRRFSSSIWYCCRGNCHRTIGDNEGHIEGQIDFSSCSFGRFFVQVRDYLLPIWVSQNASSHNISLNCPCGNITMSLPVKQSQRDRRQIVAWPQGDVTSRLHNLLHLTKMKRKKRTIRIEKYRSAILMELIF